MLSYYRDKFTEAGYFMKWFFANDLFFSSTVQLFLNLDGQKKIGRMLFGFELLVKIKSDSCSRTFCEKVLAPVV